MMVFATTQIKLISSSTTIFRMVCILITVMTIVVPPSTRAAPNFESLPSDEWPAKVVPVVVGATTTITGPLRQFSEIPDYGRGLGSKEPLHHFGYRDRKHDVEQKHGKHGRGGKHRKHGSGGPRIPRLNKAHRKEYIVDRKLVIVNFWEEQKLSNRPTSSPSPVLTNVSETVAEPYRRGDQLLHSIGLVNAAWLVILIIWTALMVFMYRGRWSDRTKHLGVMELTNEMETAVELKSLAQLKTANDHKPLINSETV